MRFAMSLFFIFMNLNVSADETRWIRSEDVFQSRPRPKRSEPKKKTQLEQVFEISRYGELDRWYPAKGKVQCRFHRSPRMVANTEGTHQIELFAYCSSVGGVGRIRTLIKIGPLDSTEATAFQLLIQDAKETRGHVVVHFSHVQRHEPRAMIAQEIRATKIISHPTREDLHRP